MMNGSRGSFVEIMAHRISKAGKERISCEIERDVDSIAREAVPGVTVKTVSSGLNIRFLRVPFFFWSLCVSCMYLAVRF
jgi:hypothetical protein